MCNDALKLAIFGKGNKGTDLRRQANPDMLNLKENPTHTFSNQTTENQRCLESKEEKKVTYYIWGSN